MDPETNWSGKTAIVTGAASGIGAAVAVQLASLGVAVTAATLRAGEGGEEVVAGIRSRGGKARLHTGDLAEPGDVADLVGAATAEFGPPDVVAHAAGGFTRPSGIAETTPAEWDAVLAINLRSTYLLMNAVLPGMAKRGWGRFVTVASEAGRMPTKTGSPAYTAAKAGVIGLTKHVAREVASRGVTVNATAPSTTLSPRVAAVHGANVSRLADAHPMGRLATPEEQAAAIVFLCSPAASYVNGACLDVTGGSINI